MTSILHKDQMNINVILAKKNLCSETPKHIFEKKNVTFVKKDSLD